MEQRDVAQLMLYGVALWPRTFVVPSDERELTVAKQAWMDVLGDLDAGTVRAAMADWADHWPPSPHELRKAALGRLALEAGTRPAPDADEAWREFRRDYRLDYEGGHEWSHSAVAAAARSLGCHSFGQSPEADEMAWRAHFIKMYDVAARRHARETTPEPPVLARRTQREALRAVSEIGSGQSDGEGR